MPMILSRIGATLALLAISMQLVICAWGGRICFRVAPMPVSSECATACCGVSENVENRLPAIGFTVAAFPTAPFEPDCCLEPALEYLGQPTVHLNLPSPTDFTAVVTAIAATSLPPASVGTNCSPARHLGLAPPSLQVVRATVLLL